MTLLTRLPCLLTTKTQSSHTLARPWFGRLMHAASEAVLLSSLREAEHVAAEWQAAKESEVSARAAGQACLASEVAVR